MATDYTGFTVEDWEKLGHQIERSEARVSGPAGDSVGNELRDYSARQLNAWIKAIDDTISDIRVEAERRQNRLRTARKQIRRALEGV
jgi:hypothetical protein